MEFTLGDPREHMGDPREHLCDAKEGLGDPRWRLGDPRWRLIKTMRLKLGPFSSTFQALSRFFENAW
jgi:hypothetical protein